MYNSSVTTISNRMDGKESAAVCRYGRCALVLSLCTANKTNTCCVATAAVLGWLTSRCAIILHVIAGPPSIRHPEHLLLLFLVVASPVLLQSTLLPAQQLFALRLSNHLVLMDLLLLVFEAQVPLQQTHSGFL